MSPVPVPMVPFNVPYLVGSEASYISDALTRRHLSGDGDYTRRSVDLIREISSVEHVLLTTSCTHALELSAVLMDLRPGDEVILPSFTFVSSANAFILRGATPRFVDIRPDTWNIDDRLIGDVITPRTKVIVVVHYAGVACEMDPIVRLARAHGLTVIEDNAHGFGAYYKDRPLGTLGDMATLSFHATKNIQCGEGGALMMANDELAARAEIVREKGTNRSRFLRGEVDKYTWVDVGSSYLPSELNAACLTAQLECFSEIQGARMAIWNRYREGLTAWASSNGIRMQQIPDDRVHSAHLFGLVFGDIETRQRFIDHMAAGGVRSTFHYVPLHSAPYGLGLTGHLDLPITDAVAAGLVRLPLYPDLGAQTVDWVVELATEFQS